MATQRLTDGGDTIDFKALIRQPDLHFKVRNEALDGSLYIYERGDAKEFYELQVSHISSANAVIINNWIKDSDSVTFTLNQDDAPGTTITARIVNESRALQMMPGPQDTLYKGTLFVRET